MKRSACILFKSGGGPQLLVDGVELPTTSGEVPEVLWVHLATEGTYKGHRAGEFTIDRGVLQQFVDHVHSHPQFKAGADGTGVAPVVPWDYNHASEMDPTAYATSGAPSIAWTLDMAIRSGPKGLELWGLTKLGTQLREQIQRGEYRWVSIAFRTASDDWQSGDPAGAFISSIAATNTPFLRHLTPIAASAGRADSPLVCLSSAGKQTPVDPGTREKTNMVLSDFAKRMVGVLSTSQVKPSKIRMLATDDDVAAAAEEVVAAANDGAASGAGLTSILEAMGVADAQAALEALPKLVAARDQLAAAQAELDAMVGAQATVEDEVAAADVAAAMSAGSFGDAVRPALLAHRRDLFRQAQVEAEKTLLAEIQSKDPQSKRQPGKLAIALSARKAASEAFRKAYSVPPADQAHLLNATAVQDDGTAIKVAGDGTGEPRKPGERNGPTQKDGHRVIDLSAFSDEPNSFAKVLAYVKAENTKRGLSADYDRDYRQAQRLSRDPNVTLTTGPAS